MVAFYHTIQNYRNMLLRAYCLWHTWYAGKIPSIKSCTNNLKSSMGVFIIEAGYGTTLC